LLFFAVVLLGVGRFVNDQRRRGAFWG